MTFANANPDHLEELARRLDGNSGEGGVSGELASLFTRASNLNASDAMSSLRPLQTWTTDTGPDLRNRAGYVRLDEGDPTAGLRLAGYTTEDLEGFDGEVPADALVTLNTLAANGDGLDVDLDRQPGEKIDDYLIRIASEYAEIIPGLDGHAETIAEVVKTGADWFSLTGAGIVVGTAGLNMWKYAKWERYFFSAPGSWMPGQLGNYLRSSPTMNRLLSIPGQAASNLEGRVFGGAVDAARNSWLARTRLIGGLTPNSFANFLVGNDQMARALSYKPGLDVAGRTAARAGMTGLRAAQTNMYYIGRNAYSNLRVLGNSRWASGAKSVFATARATGTLRFLGVAGGVAATGFSALNVAAQGWPWDAWDRAKDSHEKAGYLADWAEVGFNASLTAAMVAPTPWTIGAAAVTGVIYGGLKVYEHWDDITEWTGNAVDTVTDGISNAADKVGDFIGDLF